LVKALDVENLLYRIPEALRVMAAAEVRGKTPDAQAALLTQRYGMVMAERPDLDAYMADQRAKRENAEASAEGAKRGRTRQFLLGRGSAAAGWKPNFTGKLDPAIFTPRYGTMPKYGLTFLKYVNRVTMGAFMAAAYRVDNRGAFVLQRGKLADWLGTTPRLAGAALDLLRRAGVIRVLHQVGRRQATVWQFVTVAEFDLARAVRVIQAAKKKASEDVRERLVPAVGV
jgi:hypothetical protein